MNVVTLRFPAGTFAYAAPELLLNEACDSSVDLYSFGVLLWEIVTRRNPARGRLLPPTVPDECPADIVELIQVCSGQTVSRFWGYPTYTVAGVYDGSTRTR